MKANPYAFFLRQLQTLNPNWISEHRFHPVRLWRFDFALISQKIAIEINGGIWRGGRHSGGIGQIKDMEKGNAANALGWHVYHFTPKQTRDGSALKFISGII